MRVSFGEFVFDGDARELRRGEEPLHLAPKAFELLDILIGAGPRAVPKRELLDRLWPDVVVQEANLKNLVAEIRAVLGAKTIRTVPRYGYAFAAAEVPTSVACLIAGERIHGLKAGENLIGRDARCSVVLDYFGISRRHAKIRIAGDRFELEDLGSKNGTWKNGYRVRGSVELQDGDRIRLGGVPLLFRSSANTDSTATIGDL